MRLVIDTNVLKVANIARNENQQITQTCIDSAITCIASLSEGNVICLDEGDSVLNEYSANVNIERPYSLVALLLIKLRQQRYHSPDIYMVRLSMTDVGEYKDCPNSLIKAGFDRSDRKFVALARVTSATICNAVDSDWFDHADLLREEGIVVNNLCGTDPGSFRESPLTPASAG